MGTPGGTGPGVDWTDFAERLLADEPLASVELLDMISRILGRMGAFDFREDWDDLTQDVALAVVEKLKAGRVRHVDRLPGYVKQVAHSRWIDRLRKKYARRDELHAIPLEDAGDTSDVDEPSPEDLSVLKDCLEQLPPPQPELFLAVRIHKRTIPQAAADLGLSLATAGRLLAAAHARLRAILESEEERN